MVDQLTFYYHKLPVFWTSHFRHSVEMSNVLCGLSELKDRHPATFSGGQKQRLTLAVADWIDISIFILDEPTSGLDYMIMNLQQ